MGTSTSSTKRVRPGSQPTVETKLTAYGEFAFQRLGNDPAQSRELSRMSLAIWNEGSRNEEVRDVVMGGYRLWFDSLLELLREGQQGGEIRSEFDPETLVMVLIAMFDGLQVSLALGAHPLHLQLVKETIMKMVKGGILNK